jgi:hypothetical protein
VVLPLYIGFTFSLCVTPSNSVSLCSPAVPQKRLATTSITKSRETSTNMADIKNEEGRSRVGGQSITFIHDI